MKTYHYSNKLYSEWRKKTECFALKFNFSRFLFLVDLMISKKNPQKHKLEHVFNYLRKPTSISNTVTDRGPSC